MFFRRLLPDRELLREQRNLLDLQEDYDLRCLAEQARQKAHLMQSFPELTADELDRAANIMVTVWVKNEAPALALYYETKRALIAEGRKLGMNKRKAHAHMVALLPLAIGVEYREEK